MAGLFVGTYGLPLLAIGFGSLSRPNFVTGGSFQLASMNFKIETWSAYSCEMCPGAVNGENNADWNFRDLEEMLRNAKSQWRKNREPEGILNGPSMAP